MKLPSEINGSRTDKLVFRGIVHTLIGKTSFDPIKLADELYELIKNDELSFIQKSSLSGTKITDWTPSEKDHATSISQSDIEEVLNNTDWKVPLRDQKVKSRPRVLPKVNDNRSSFELKDVAFVNKKKDEPDHWETGIKAHGGVKRYRTRYKCDSCENIGNRYVPLEDQYVICHSCGNKIKKIDATTKGFPSRDSWGNFFITKGMIPYDAG